MKHRFATLLSIAAVAAFLLGWTFGEPVGPALPETTTRLAGPPLAHAQGMTPHSPFPPVASPPYLSSPEQMRAHAFQILSVPDRLERMRQFSALLTTLTAENWSSVLDAFTVQRRTEGRTFREEANLLLIRIGEVCGRSAIDDALAGKVPHGRLLVPELLQGWASTEPHAAIGWLRSQPADQQRQLNARLIQGVGRADPRLAFTLLREEPEDSWAVSTMYIFEGAIGIGGFAKAEELYSTLRADQGTPRALLQDVMARLVERRLSIATQTGDSASLLAWFDPHFRGGFDSARTDPGEALMRRAFETDREETLAWLDARADRVEADRAQKIYRALGSQWGRSDPDAATRWLRGNPNHLQQGMIATGLALALSDTSKFAEARAISEMIQEPVTRDQLAQRIQALEEARAKEAARSNPKR